MTDESKEFAIAPPLEGIEPRKLRLPEQVHEGIRRREAASEGQTMFRCSMPCVMSLFFASLEWSLI